VIGGRKQARRRVSEQSWEVILRTRELMSEQAAAMMAEGKRGQSPVGLSLQIVMRVRFVLGSGNRGKKERMAGRDPARCAAGAARDGICLLAAAAS
jgi:hypothetical protein